MTRPYKILFKYTSRSRVDWFFRGLDSILNNLFDKENYFIVCSFDEDDLTMNNDIVKNKLDKVKNLSYHFGVSKNKVHAINRDIDKFPDEWDILVNFSDDQMFTSLFFDRIIRDYYKIIFPDGDGALHFPDTKTKSALITMSIMDKKYFDRFGYIYHSDYVSLYCDNEFGDVAKILNKYHFVGINIYAHLHPAFGMAQSDEQYERTESYYHIDAVTYRQRKAINFGLDGEPDYKLSILIPTLKSRLPFFRDLVESIERQIIKENLLGKVEILSEMDNGELSIGAKRNLLLQRAKGKYVAFVDDDDRLSNDYLKLVFEGIKKGVDCCSLTGLITFDGGGGKLFKHYLGCEKYEEVDNVYLRYNNHLNCIRASIAKQFSFPEINHGEDTAFATQIHKSGLLKTQHEISTVIYYYNFITNK